MTIKVEIVCFFKKKYEMCALYCVAKNTEKVSFTYFYKESFVNWLRFARWDKNETFFNQSEF